jgi:hypothetical protein
VYFEESQLAVKDYESIRLIIAHDQDEAVYKALREFGPGSKFCLAKLEHIDLYSVERTVRKVDTEE